MDTRDTHTQDLHTRDGHERDGHARAVTEESVDVVVVGAGQAGLSTGYHLRGTGRRFVVLDDHERVGDVWRQRWDSLRLFTPAEFDSLPGWGFPAPSGYFPTKDEMADYLEGYARRFELPVRGGHRVTRVAREGDDLVVDAGGTRFRAGAVIIAMAPYQRPHVPIWAEDLDPSIHQVHAADFTNEVDDLREGAVLVVGAGNSGAELGMLAARAGHPTTLAGRDVGQIPFRPEGLLGRKGLVRLVLRGLFHRVLTVDTPLGRKVRPKVVGKGGPRIRVKARDLRRAGIATAPKVAAVRDGRPVLEDGRVLEVDNIVWCTGFQPDHSWIDLPVFEGKEPTHHTGIVDAEPGLYFVGMHFQYALSSAMVHGVGRDAARIVDHLVANVPVRAVAPTVDSAPPA